MGKSKRTVNHPPVHPSILYQIQVTILRDEKCSSPKAAKKGELQKSENLFVEMLNFGLEAYLKLAIQN